MKVTENIYVKPVIYDKSKTYTYLGTIRQWKRNPNATWAINVWAEEYINQEDTLRFGL